MTCPTTISNCVCIRTFWLAVIWLSTSDLSFQMRADPRALESSRRIFSRPSGTEFTRPMLSVWERAKYKTDNEMSWPRASVTCP